jgi:hypothetical protein
MRSHLLYIWRRARLAMDIGMRVMKQVQVSTSITLVRFLSSSLQSHMSALETCILSFLVVAVTYVVGNEYVLSPLSRRLAVLLSLERVRPMLSEQIDDGRIFHVHGLMINAGFLSVVSVIPPALKQNAEVATLVQSVIYMYSDIFGFLADDASLTLSLLAVGIVALAFFSSLKVNIGSIFSTMKDVITTSLTYLILRVIQAQSDALTETAVLKIVLTFTMLHFVHVPGMEAVEDYMVYNIAGSIQSYIRADPWYWCLALGLLMRALAGWLSYGSMAVQVLLLVVVNVAVAATLTYIKQLAIYDTVITLKTSALVLQFVVSDLSRRLS